MEKTPSETTEDPVLLSWEMPARRRKLLVSLYSIILITILSVSAGLVFYDAVHDPEHLRLVSRVLSPLLLPFWLTKWFVLDPIFAGAARVECRNSGLTINMLLAGQRRVRWDEILRLRRSKVGYTILEYGDRGKQYVYLHIGADIRERLVAILRETSNARIIGFGPEGS